MRRFLVAGLAVLFAVVLFNCDQLQTPLDNAGNTPQDSTGNGGGTTLTVEALVDSANQALGEFMVANMNNPPDDPLTMNYSVLSDINSLYRQAVEMDSTNAGANFGAGLTELLLIVEDGSSFSTEIQRWQAFMDTTTIFGEPLADQSGAGKVVADQSTLLAKNPLSLETSPEVSAGSYLKAMLSLPKYAQEYPEFSDWQDLLESTLLKRIDYAIDRLAAVEQDASFAFTITPEMQGDPNATPRELDLTEVYLFDSFLHGIRAIGGMAISYNVNLSPYDTTAFDRLEPGGTFMTLRKTGTMAGVLDDINGVLDKADDALTFLANEPDDQTNDVIVVSPTPVEGEPTVTSEEITLAHQAIDSVRQAFSGPMDIDISQDQNTLQKTSVTGGDMADGIITVDISKLFSPEIPDVKTFLPGYTIVAGSDTMYEYVDSLSVRDSIPAGATASVTVDSAGGYQFGYWVDYDAYWGTKRPGWEQNNNLDIPEFVAAVNAQLEELISMQLPAGQRLEWASADIHWWGHFDGAGTYDITAIIYYNYNVEQATTKEYYPVPIWDADTYSGWLEGFTDPTFFGVFPNFTIDDWSAIFAEDGLTAVTWVKDMRNFHPVQTVK